jgi:hypothetical protein
VLEGVPRAASMGILLFGLSGVIILTLTARMLASRKPNRGDRASDA